MIGQKHRTLLDNGMRRGKWTAEKGQVLTGLNCGGGAGPWGGKGGGPPLKLGGGGMPGGKAPAPAAAC